MRHKEPAPWKGSGAGQTQPNVASIFALLKLSTMRQTIDPQQAFRLRSKGWTYRQIGEFQAMEQGRKVNYWDQGIRKAIAGLGVVEGEFYRGTQCGKPYPSGGPMECVLCGRRGLVKRDLCFAVKVTKEWVSK
jgi:hypothetical protein